LASIVRAILTLCFFLYIRGSPRAWLSPVYGTLLPCFGWGPGAGSSPMEETRIWEPYSWSGFCFPTVVPSSHPFLRFKGQLQSLFDFVNPPLQQSANMKVKRNDFSPPLFFSLFRPSFSLKRSFHFMACRAGRFSFPEDFQVSLEVGLLVKLSIWPVPMPSWWLCGFRGAVQGAVC